MDNSSPSALGTSVSLVLGEIKNVKELHRSARHAKLLQFATDICLVAHGVRTGYLVDALYPPNPVQTLTTLLMALRGKDSIFKKVVLWHHGPTAQSFLVHAVLLQEKLAALLDGIGEGVFVVLNKNLTVSREPPDKLQEVIQDMRYSMAESPEAISFFLPDTLTQVVLVPLAAVMIDYPVAYCPASSAQTSFLDGETLDVYTVSLKGNPTLDLGKEHIFLKFSCPQVLVSEYAELSRGTVMENLRVKFTVSLECAGMGMRVCVAHRTEVLDRVAL